MGEAGLKFLQADTVSQVVFEFFILKIVIIHSDNVNNTYKIPIDSNQTKKVFASSFLNFSYL